MSSNTQLLYFSFVGKDAFSAACTPQIVPPALCSSRISSGLTPWPVAFLALWQEITRVVMCPCPGSAPRTVEQLALMAPSVSALFSGAVSSLEAHLSTSFLDNMDVLDLLVSVYCVSAKSKLTHLVVCMHKEHNNVTHSTRK